MGSRSKPIRQALEEAKRFRRNALSQVDADSKDHEYRRKNLLKNLVFPIDTSAILKGEAPMAL